MSKATFLTFDGTVIVPNPPTVLYMEGRRQWHAYIITAGGLHSNPDKVRAMKACDYTYVNRKRARKAETTFNPEWVMCPICRRRVTAFIVEIP